MFIGSCSSFHFAPMISKGTHSASSNDRSNYWHEDDKGKDNVKRRSWNQMEEPEKKQLFTSTTRKERKLDWAEEVAMILDDSLPTEKADNEADTANDTQNNTSTRSYSFTSSSSVMAAPHHPPEDLKQTVYLDEWQDWDNWFEADNGR